MVNICTSIHLLLVILPKRCEFEMREHRHLLHKHISQICEAQLYLILFYSHSTNQPKYICCLCGKGFKINMKMGLNQISFADHMKKFFKNIIGKWDFVIGIYNETERVANHQLTSTRMPGILKVFI